MMGNFWWGMNENGSKIHWRSWNLLCKNKGEGGMGFRSFIQFNQALLAKQAWRLLENPTSLLGQLLKSKYFPHNSFLDANMGHSPSLTWQGIRWGRELLIKGLRWKIGEGRSIGCGLDSWIPGLSTFLPICYSGPSHGVVANLITEERQWNIPLLQQYFCQLDLERILTIPLSYFSTRDKLIWHYQSSSIFTVQSAYHLATLLADENLSSSSTSELAWWKLFWSLQIPQKVKIFAWRITHDSLPVATSLVRRKIITDSTCSIHKQAWEITGHALFSCKYAKAVWRSLNYNFDWYGCTSMRNGDYLIHLSLVYNKAELEQLFCTLWAIWTERNKTVTCQIPPAPVPWPSPPVGAFKLNIDAAINASTFTTGVGAVLQDSAGLVTAALAMPIIGNFKFDEMEAKALFHSLNWAIQH
uniref:Reverse transcriptase zinc-binding domain-containing protein n=1 Tax=Cannabis sativa TaxID=3483 RepID=A0A803PIB5_CANSA